MKLALKRELGVQTLKKHRPIISIGYQSKSGEIIVTDVLCDRFPDITDDEMANLSAKLCIWSNNLRCR